MEEIKNLDPKKYAESVFLRRNKAIILGQAVIEGGDWKPQPNECHQNVTTWCSHNPNFTIVRGWLYFDLHELIYVKFVAHSAVSAPKGKLFDITPSRAPQAYPFIASNLSEETYAKLVESLPKGEIIYAPPPA